MSDLYEMPRKDPTRLGLPRKTQVLFTPTETDRAWFAAHPGRRLTERTRARGWDDLYAPPIGYADRALPRRSVTGGREHPRALA